MEDTLTFNQPSMEQYLKYAVIMTRNVKYIYYNKRYCMNGVHNSKVRYISFTLTQDDHVM